MRWIGFGIATSLLPAFFAVSGYSRQTPTAAAAPAAASPDPAKGVQPKRILGIIPNYRTVSANTTLPRLSVHEKVRLATQDSFDYSSFIFVGLLAGTAETQHSYPEFHTGVAGFGRYYWHSFADQAAGNYLSEAIVPTVFHEDPRYYTLGHGRVPFRAGYAASRLFVTRTDSGGHQFNFSEIAGNGLGAALSNLYYPSSQRTWTKTQQKWVTEIALDGVFNIFKEYWPDVSRLASRSHH